MSTTTFLVGCLLLAQVADRYGPTDYDIDRSQSSNSSAVSPFDTKPSPSRSGTREYDGFRSSSNEPGPLTSPYGQNGDVPPRAHLAAPLGSSFRAPSREDMHALGIPTGDQSSASLRDASRIADSDKADDIPKPAELMAAMLTSPPDSRISGRPITLTEVVSGAGSRRDQTQRVVAYWDLCSSVSDYYLGLHEQQELRRLRQLFQQVGDAWRQAEAEMGVRIGTSERAAIASQYRLARLMGRSEQGPLPLPGNMPHCGDYYTRYEEIFADRRSQEAAELDELLPLRYDELKAAGAAVVRAEQWVDWVASRRSEASDGTGVIRALELLALRRRAFVQIARDYNRRIARYSELATPGQVEPRELVGMLIKTDEKQDTATRYNRVNDGRQSRSRTNEATPTFAADTAEWTASGGGETDSAVVPASHEEEVEPSRVERSVLIRH